MIEKDIAKLPDHLVSQMQQAVETADFQMLVDLIPTFENDFPELSRHLLAQANNYNYVYLLQVLTKREINER